MNGTEEFMQLATIAHVMSAAIQIAGVTNMSELSSKILSSDKPYMAGISCCGNMGLGTRLAPPCARNGLASILARVTINKYYFNVNGACSAFFLSLLAPGK